MSMITIVSNRSFAKKLAMCSHGYLKIEQRTTVSTSNLATIDVLAHTMCHRISNSLLLFFNILFCCVVHIHIIVRIIVIICILRLCSKRELYQFYHKKNIQYWHMTWKRALFHIHQYEDTNSKNVFIWDPNRQ